MLPTIEWNDEAVVMIDQRKLPGVEIYVTCKSAKDVAKAIKTMVIRGAPAIGVAAAMGLALGVRQSTATGTTKLAGEFYKLCEMMADTRPTAVNLFWAIDRMKRVFAEAASSGQSVDQIKRQARRRSAHDSRRRRRELPRDGSVRRDASCPKAARVLTHCNAGALATAGYGTALGVIRGAVEQGKKVAVIADETRPFLQGARLTAWELTRDGIDTTVITDNMSGALMLGGQIDLVVVGADRIAANGDVANKIGTYTVAVLAKEHGIPFYVAAPISTIDLATPDGSGHSHRGAQRERSDASGPDAAHARGGQSPEPGLRRDAAQVRDGHHHRARHRPRAVSESCRTRQRNGRLKIEKRLPTIVC